MAISWSKQEKKIVIEMSAANYDFREIASVLKSRTWESIRQYCTKNEIANKQNSPQIDMDAFAEMMKARKVKVI